ncbi:MAG: peptidoglycan -binding protein [Alphaproteobacteria bacterium]|nr:peptidoglycan -binding protein [Alphaproteobacteria bacterium]
MVRRRDSTAGAANIWPGFVDALATLLLVIIFLLVVFVLAQVLLTQAISGKDEALDRLNRQVAELAELLNLERQANVDLRLNIAQLSSSLQNTTSDRDQLQVQLHQMVIRAGQAEDALAAAQSRAQISKEAGQRHLLELESLRRDIEALRELRDTLEAQAGKMSQNLATRETELGRLRDRRKALQAELASQQERTLLAQKEIEEREIRLSELLDLYTRLEEDYKAEKALSKEQRSQVGLLNQQIQALRREIQQLIAALEASEAKDKKNEATISDLGRRLNRALASKVQELTRYRSEFFGRLREVLGQRRGVRVVGDRFVFQSEVLFASGSALLERDGQEQIARLAATLIEISEQIPAEINWVLRVDGHTDTIPIATAQFPSNWELSAARAIAVVKFLVEQGVPANRLAATGFGEFQAIDTRPGEIANRRNRRIEFKLTQR